MFRMTTAMMTALVLGLGLSASSDTLQAAEAVAYRLTDWKQIHFDNPQTAEQHLQAVRKLGCEVRQEQHAGHTDVIYRAAHWQALEVASDELAHQWESWLQKSGFQTLHGHAADHAVEDHHGHDHAGHDHHDHAGHVHAPGAAELVNYRLGTWKATRLDSEIRQAEFVALMKGLGCEVQPVDELEVRVRCPQWKHIELNSHQLASGWEDWLRRAGFEVRHDH